MVNFRELYTSPRDIMDGLKNPVTGITTYSAVNPIYTGWGASLWEDGFVSP